MVVGGCGVLFPAATTVLFPLSFALLAATAAFALDEPASLVVDVTPTGAFRRTAVRALALLVPRPSVRCCWSRARCAGWRCRGDRPRSR
jgi:hypothetical protein